MNLPVNDFAVLASPGFHLAVGRKRLERQMTEDWKMGYGGDVDCALDVYVEITNLIRDIRELEP